MTLLEQFLREEEIHDLYLAQCSKDEPVDYTSIGGNFPYARTDQGSAFWHLVRDCYIMWECKEDNKVHNELSEGVTGEYDADIQSIIIEASTSELNSRADTFSWVNN